MPETPKPTDPDIPEMPSPSWRPGAPRAGHGLQFMRRPLFGRDGEIVGHVWDYEGMEMEAMRQLRRRAPATPPEPEAK